jgi:CRISPR-associated protein Cmr3
MNTILLSPNDVLFFRDGRPMEGSLAGHGAAWPLPNVISAALHAALHRADFRDTHTHRFIQKGSAAARSRRFGSLVTAGPFPVRVDKTGSQTWFFPRPLDLSGAGLQSGLAPSRAQNWRQSGSLREPLRFPVASRRPPSKETPAPDWLTAASWYAYLSGETGAALTGLNDLEFLDTEHTIGIGIDPSTQSAADGKIYSAHFLRLREGFRLGIAYQAPEKDRNGRANGSDIIRRLFSSPRHIVVGGQQRVCTAELISNQLALPLPFGRRNGFHATKEGCALVKWILLSPAVWPAIAAGQSIGGQIIHAHPGGWLPNWIDPSTGDVLLKRRSGKIWRSGRRRQSEEESPIAARLVAALTAKPVVVTGWSVGDPESTEAALGGAKSTHLAVPAGAVYYFEADDEAVAAKLAGALNWDGDSAGATIRNRRSTLLGEKGFGLGVCGTWQFFEDANGGPGSR